MYIVNINSHINSPAFTILAVPRRDERYNKKRSRDQQLWLGYTLTCTNNFGLVTHLHGSIVLQQLLSTKESREGVIQIIWTHIFIIENTSNNQHQAFNQKRVTKQQFVYFASDILHAYTQFITNLREEQCIHTQSVEHRKKRDWTWYIYSHTYTNIYIGIAVTSISIFLRCQFLLGSSTGARIRLQCILAVIYLPLFVKMPHIRNQIVKDKKGKYKNKCTIGNIKLFFQ